MKININFQFKQSIPDSVFRISNRRGIDKIWTHVEFWQDEDFSICGRLSCKVKDISKFLDLGKYQKRLVPGKIIPDNNSLSCIDKNSTGFKARHLRLESPNLDGFGNAVQPFKVRILESLSKDSNSDYIVFYLANGLKQSDFFYTRYFSRKLSATLDIDLSPDFKEQILRHSGESTSAACFQFGKSKCYFGLEKIEYNNHEYLCSFILTKSKSSSIFREITLLRDFLSFLTGKDFAYLGWAKFKHNSNLVQRYILESQVSDIKSAIAIYTYPPIPVESNHYDSGEHFEKTINNLLMNYLKARKYLPLDQTVYMLNRSREQSLELSVNPLSASFDSIKKAWFKSKNSKSKGKALQDNSYNGIIQKYLDKIESDLPLEPDAKKPILSRIGKANEYSQSENSEIFFKEIGMPYTEIEKEILWSRNIFVHGLNDNAEHQKILDYSHGYRTLLAKAILTILNYNGKYIDYSSRGFKIKPMSSSLEGTENYKNNKKSL